MYPLESHFKEKAADATQLPFDHDYFMRYESMLEYLKREIYPLINAGLSALSEDSGIYTSHGPEHFDEVVKYAGLVLDVDNSGKSQSLLSAYELYLLLCAIRLHDAGNIFGREEHENKVFKILWDMGALAGNDLVEKRTISEIAKAHGGRTPNGDKDTIRTLRDTDNYGAISYRPRLIAALVRFADEICEHRLRAANYLLDQGEIPPHNEVFHHYAAAIRAVRPDRTDKSLYIKYVVEKKDVVRKMGCGTSDSPAEKYLIDYIFDRLVKMNQERIYCNRFLDGIYTTERIDIEIEVCQADGLTLDAEKITIIDEGYPTDCNQWRDNHLEFCGDNLCKKHTE